MRVCELSEKLRNNVSQVMVGCEQASDLIFMCLLSEGHVLLEDVPGTGKTMLAKTIAKSLNVEFKRIQFQVI